MVPTCFIMPAYHFTCLTLHHGMGLLVSLRHGSGVSRKRRLHGSGVHGSGEGGGYTAVRMVVMPNMLHFAEHGAFQFKPC
jgi:hypothetical protein